MTIKAAYNMRFGVVAGRGYRLNSLLLVDFTNQPRLEGHSIDETIRMAGETRFLAGCIDFDN